MRTSLLVALIATLLPTAGAMAGQVYRSDTVRTTTLPIGNTSGTKAVIYSVGPINIPAGSVADVRFQAQLTNDCGNNVGVGRWVIQTSTDRYYNGTYITVPAIENITPGEHHGVLTQSTITNPYSTAVSAQYFNVIMYAISSDPSCYGSNLSVDDDGEIVVEIR